MRVRFNILSASLAVAAAGIVLASAGAALAAPRLSDSAYLQASQCAGAAVALGRDVAGLDARLTLEGRSRQAAVLERARDARLNAERSGRRADELGRQRLAARWDATCAAVAAS
ncbi:MAG TPA: hypothetical protein VGB49_08845 [Caulobacteraceae bacterium]